MEEWTKNKVFHLLFAKYFYGSEFLPCILVYYDTVLQAGKQVPVCQGTSDRRFEVSHNYQNKILDVITQYNKTLWVWETQAYGNHLFIMNTDLFKMIWKVCRVLAVLATKIAVKFVDSVWQPLICFLIVVMNLMGRYTYGKYVLSIRLFLFEI
jgi:hypothetical protein